MSTRAARRYPGMSEHAAAPRKARAGPASEPWGRAFLTSAVMLAACYLLLVLVPNNLLSYLSLHTQPKCATSW